MYQIQQVSDVHVDACVRNEAGQLMFLSAFGRDTAIKELMARMELGTGDNHSLSELTLKGTCDHAGESHAVGCRLKRQRWRSARLIRLSRRLRCGITTTP